MEAGCWLSKSFSGLVVRRASNKEFLSAFKVNQIGGEGERGIRQAAEKYRTINSWNLVLNLSKQIIGPDGRGHDLGFCLKFARSHFFGAFISGRWGLWKGNYNWWLISVGCDTFMHQMCLTVLTLEEFTLTPRKIYLLLSLKKNLNSPST